CGVTPVTLVRVHLGQRLDVVADASCDGREWFAGVELRAREPVTEVVEAQCLGTGSPLADASERLGQSVRWDRRHAGGVLDEIGEDVGLGGGAAAPGGGTLRAFGLG